LHVYGLIAACRAPGIKASLDAMSSMFMIDGIGVYDRSMLGRPEEILALSNCHLFELLGREKGINSTSDWHGVFWSHAR
jgi:hypothetical protein